jgi:O-antigen/teichoic acid export membrane protein
MLDAAIAFAIRVFSAGLVFGLQVLLARLMPLDGYGGFVTLWTWLLAIGSFAALGFAESSVRFLPRYRARGREAQVRAYWRYGFRAVVLGSLALAGLALVLAFVLGTRTEPGLIVLYVAIGLPFLAVEYYLEGVARSFGWFRLTTVPVYIVRPLLIGAVCLAIYVSGVPLTLPVVGAAVVGSMALVSCGLALVIAARMRGQAPAGKPVAASESLWLRASLPLLLVSGLEDLLAYCDVLILSLMLPGTDVGLYFAAARALALTNFVYYAMYLVSGRRFALDMADADRSRLQRSVREASRLTFWLTIVAVALTLAAGPLLLRAFGPEFVTAYPVMAILALGHVARAASGQAGELLIVAGRQRESIFIGFGVLALNVALTVALVLAFGLYGAAIGTAIALAGRSVALAFVVHRTTGISAVSLGLPSMKKPRE